MKFEDVGYTVKCLLVSSVGYSGATNLQKTAEETEGILSLAYNTAAVMGVGLFGLSAYGITRVIGRILDHHEPKL